MAKRTVYVARRQFVSHGQLIERGQEVPAAARWRPAVREHYCKAVQVEVPDEMAAPVSEEPVTVRPDKAQAARVVVQPNPAEPEAELALETEPEGADEALQQVEEPAVKTVSLSGVARARGGSQVGRQAESKGRKQRRGE